VANHSPSLGLVFSLVLACAVAGVNAAQKPSDSQLPPPNLDNFSAPIRDQIQQAYADAHAHPQDANAIGRLGMVLETYSLLNEAAKSYDRASQLAPSDFRWVYHLGRVQSSQGHCDSAAATLRTAAKIDPQYVPAQLHLANCLLSSGRPAAAEELYDAIVKAQADNADAYYGLGRARAARRDYTGASAAYRKACDLAPQFGAAHYALALAYRASGQAEQAQQELRLYDKNKDGAPPANDPLLAEVRALNHSASFQVQIGTQLEKQGKLEESIAAHEKALEIDPNLLQAHVNLIALYGRVGQFENAEQHYKAAVQLDPSSAESYYDYGVLLVSEQKYAEAETAFRKTIELDPLHAGAHTNLGFLLERQGRLADAIAEYRQAAANAPNNRQAHFNLGRSLVSLRNYAEGIQELRKTLEPKDQDTPRYVYALGAALARSGDRQNALAYLREARDGAQAQGQTALVASIDRDLRTLEATGTPQ
jgi:tetratricopeptide (TPR) repeat protein